MHLGSAPLASDPLISSERTTMPTPMRLVTMAFPFEGTPAAGLALVRGKVVNRADEATVTREKNREIPR